VAAILVSLALNAFLFLIMGRLGAFAPPTPPAEARPVALAPLTADQWNANRAIVGGKAPAVLPPRQEQPQTPPPPEQRKERGQIVDVAPSQDSRKPKDSRFLSDRDNTVEKETRSRYAGTQKWENTLPTPSAGSQGKQGAPAPGEAGHAERSAPGKEGPKRGGDAVRPSTPGQQQQDRLALAKPPGQGPGDVAVKPKEELREPGAGDALKLPGEPGARGESEGGERKSGPIDPRLLPDAQSLARIAGGPAPNRLEDIEEGEGTALNTRSFKYATFYNRVGMAIYRQWDPNRAYRARDPDGKMFPARDRTTLMEVVLDGTTGAVAFVKVLESSGLDFLDEEIVRATKAAGPFPNPPPGLVENGMIRMTLAYTLEMRHSSRVQVVLPTSPSQRPYPD
jgi:TonB family protein